MEGPHPMWWRRFSRVYRGRRNRPRPRPQSTSLPRRDAKIPELDFRAGIMGLQLQRAGGGPSAEAGIVVEFPLVLPVDGLIAIPPRRQAIANRRNGVMEPFAIPAQQATGVLAIVQSPCRPLP